MDISKAQDILDYWLPKNGLADCNKWFLKSRNYDEEIKNKFGSLLKEAEKGKGYGWLVSKDSFIAYIILMDQFSRHIYRDKPDAYKNDKGTIIFTEMGFDIYKDDLVGYEFMFAFMPYMHTENINLQKKGLDYFLNHIKLYSYDNNPSTRRKLNNPPNVFLTDEIKLSQYDKEYMMLLSMDKHVRGHLETINKFGRFPKRNNILNRISTKKELEYLQSNDIKNRPY